MRHKSSYYNSGRLYSEIVYQITRSRCHFGQNV